MYLNSVEGIINLYNKNNEFTVIAIYLNNKGDLGAFKKWMLSQSDDDLPNERITRNSNFYNFLDKRGN